MLMLMPYKKMDHNILDMLVPKIIRTLIVRWEKVPF